MPAGPQSGRVITLAEKKENHTSLIRLIMHQNCPENPFEFSQQPHFRDKESEAQRDQLV